MSDEVIRVRFDNKVSEHIHACRVYEANRWLAKVDKVVAVLLLCMGIFAVATVGVLWWSVICFVLAPLEWFNALSLRPLQVRLAFRMNPKFGETYDIEFSDSGIHWITKSFDSRIAWTHFTSMLENDRVILLLYGRGMYSVIPKRAFENEAQMVAFREMFNRNVKP